MAAPGDAGRGVIQKPERWGHIQDLFYQAVEMPEHQRDSWLLQRCAHDVTLWREVASLLAADALEHDDMAAAVRDAARAALLERAREAAKRG